MTHPHYISGTWTVPPGEMVAVNRSAEFLTCLNAASPFRIRIGSGPETDFEQGLTFRSDRSFDRVEIVNPHAQELSVTLGFGRGDIHDNRLVIASAVNTIERTIIRPISSDDSTVNIGNGITASWNLWEVVKRNPNPFTEIVPASKIRKSVQISIMSDSAKLSVHPALSGSCGYFPLVTLSAGEIAEIPGGSRLLARSPDGNAKFCIYEEVYL